MKKNFSVSLILIIFLLSSCQSFSQFSSTATPVPPTKTVTPIPPTATFTPIPLTSTPTPIPPTATPKFRIGSTMTSEKDGMVLIYVPTGEFKMGSDGGENNERPIHMVYLDAFWIDQTEVTNGMYARCVEDGQCEPPDVVGSFYRGMYYGKPDFDNFPVIHVSWEKASTYCSWAGRNLPTEAQWEKAARGTDQRTYPWGNEIDCSFLNYSDKDKGCWTKDTTPVGSYEAGKSPYGAYDMAGNVYEWVNDWYSENYYSYSPSINPLGPESGKSRVIRGGAWSFYEEQARSTYRTYNYDDPALFSSVEVGFRCAMSASE